MQKIGLWIVLRHMVHRSTRSALTALQVALFILLVIGLLSRTLATKVLCLIYLPLLEGVIRLLVSLACFAHLPVPYSHRSMFRYIFPLPITVIYLTNNARSSEPPTACLHDATTFSDPATSSSRGIASVVH